MSGRSTRFVAALLFAFVPFAVLLWRFDWLCDDAYISFRYARNLARGLGLCFNPGVSPPVEGYTNFLWVLAMALVERLGGDPALWSRLLSALSGAALLVVLLRLVAVRCGTSGPALPAAALFLGTFAPFAVWSTGGLETMPFALALFCVFERLLGDPARPRGLQAAGFAVLAVLLRGDGLVWVLLVLFSALLGRRSTGLKASVVVLCIAAAVVLLHVNWRLSYHGDWLPNTARAKVGLSVASLARGWRYLAGFCLAFPAWPLAALVGFGCALRARDRLLLPAAGLLLGGCAWVLLVGGDFMAMGRFLVPTFPIVSLLLALGIAARFSGSMRGHLIGAALAALLCLLSLLPAFDLNPVPASQRARFHLRLNARDFGSELSVWRGMKERARTWGLIGRAVRLHTAPEASLVAGAIGALGYYSERQILDRNGLVDREVARAPQVSGGRSPGHTRFVPLEFFRDRAPTYVWANLVDTSTGRLLMPERFGGGFSPEEFTIRTIPLSAEEGFPPDLALRLVSWRRR